MRLKDSLRYAMLSGRDIKSVRQNIAKRVWGNSSESTRIVNVSNLFREKTKKYDEEVIKIICDETGVDANFLFGIKPMKRIHENL